MQLVLCKGGEQTPLLFELDGPEALGSILQIIPCSEVAPDISQLSVQWYRLSADGERKGLISGTFFAAWTLHIVVFFLPKVSQVYTTGSLIVQNFNVSFYQYYSCNSDCQQKEMITIF